MNTIKPTNLSSSASEFNARIASLNTLQDEAAILLKGASAKQIEAYNQALADMYEVYGPFDLEAA